MFIVHTAPFANKFAPTPCGQKLENVTTTQSAHRYAHVRF
ncbi:hypothetical protein ALO75_102971 [Pseudomonas syringae pv. coryli]|uniref:Uncharacterized protein n=2 Tax=Pseudomonas syringae group TaxID=136849 RepID=A0A3M5WGP5_9PSED|nr:hypothetical protein ALO75_102971 [Pseudomonas syringae pv. coryli]RMU68825.1 hypothetical protein ALP23_102462 [Pseudomonas syringae pv. apii]